MRMSYNFLKLTSTTHLSPDTLQSHLAIISDPRNYTHPAFSAIQPIITMSFKSGDQGLTPALIEAREKEVMDDIDKLIDKKLYFALARVIPSESSAAAIVDDPEIQEQAENLKTAVAALIQSHQSIITTIAKSKKDKDNEKPV